MYGTTKWDFITNVILRKKNKAEKSITLPDVKLYSKGISNQNRIVLAQQQTCGLANKKESPENNHPPISGQLIYDKRAENAQGGKKSLLKKWRWEHWTTICKRMKLGHYLISHPQIN